MAYSKVILNGNTLMDTTDKTVDAGSMLSGITALKNDGTTATGTIQSRTASDLTASGATVTVPAGNYASQATKSVATGTEGTPTATKGAVSNHSVTVTPSVTNTAGYISGGTKTGTGVSVNVTELESGTKSITANGTGISVSGYSAVDVAVPSSSPTLITKSITANGTYDAEDDNADGYSSVTVNVSGGGGGGDYPWFGPNTVKDYTKTITINLKDDTSWDSWTASTTAGSILAAPTTADFSYTFNYKDYIATIVSTAITSYTFKSTATKKNIPFANGRVDMLWQFGYPSTYDNYMNYAIGTYSNISQAIKQTIYYYSGTGVKSASASSSNGVYTYSTPSISTTTSGDNITLTYKRSPIYAKCNTTYFAVERKDDIDSENTNLIITVDVYKTPINNNFIWKLIEEMVTGMNSAPEV